MVETEFGLRLAATFCEKSLLVLLAVAGAAANALKLVPGQSRTAFEKPRRRSRESGLQALLLLYTSTLWLVTS